MACRERGGTTILLCLGFILVVSSFCHGTILTKLKALDTLRGNSTLGHGLTKGNELHHGRLMIGQNALQVAKVKGAKATKNLLEVDTDYQADMGWGEHKKPKGQDHGFSRQKQDNAAVDRLLKMEPKVECTGDSMKLQVQDAASTPGSLLFVDRGSRLSPLPLSKLPPSCGYSIQSTRRDLVLVAPYDGCFVALEEDTYVLPLRWWGLPVRMSCPLMKQSSPNPPMVTCHAEGMVVKTEWTSSVANIKVKLTADWEPLMTASTRCGFSVVAHPEGVVLSVRYAPCLEKTDGMYTLELAGEGEAKISCPSLSPAQPEPTKSPVKDPNQQTEAPSKGVYPSTSSHNSASNHAPEPTIDKPHWPYFPNYPNFFPQPVNPDAKPTPIIKPSSPPVTNKNDGLQSQPTDPPMKPPITSGQVHQPFYPFPHYPQPATKPEAPEGQVYQPFFPQPQPATKPTAATEPPQPDAPQGQVFQQFYPYHYPFYPQPEPENQPASKPTAAPKPPKPEAPQGQVYQQFFSQPEPENKPAEKPTAAPKPPQPDAPQGQVFQQLYPYHYPFYPQPEPENQPATKPTAVPKPEAPQGQVQQQFFSQPEPENKPAEKPTTAPKPPQPDAPQGQVFQQFYPYHYPFYPRPEPENQPATKPTAAPKTPKPEAPQGQVYQQFFSQPEPENKPAEKPTAAPKPQQPDAPQGQVFQQFYPYHYPFYPRPEPENQPATKPTAAPKTPKPEAPQGQVQQQFFSQPEPENKPAEKPTTAPKPPQPDAPQGQVFQQFYPYHYPFYPRPEPENQPATKPTAAPKTPKPEAPQGQVYQQFFSQPEPENKPAEKPTAAPKPPQPDAPQGQVFQQLYPYHYPFYPQPEPENQPATKPTAAPKPEAPQGQVQQQFFSQPEPENKPAEKPTTAPKPPQPDAPQGQVFQQFYPYHYPFYPRPEPENQPATKPTAAPKTPKPEAPQGQVYQQFFSQPEPENKPAEKPTAAPKPPQPDAPQGQVFQQLYPYHYPFYPQPEPENQPATKPTAAPKPEAPQGQVQQQFFSQPEPENKPAEKPTTAPKPPQPDAPQGQVFQQFYPYHYPFYPRPEPENQPATKPTAAPKPEAPQGQVQQQFFSQPEPENKPAEKPTTAPKPPQPDAPQGQVFQQFYPYHYPFYPRPEPENQPATKPTAATEPEAPQGQVQQQFFSQPEPENKPAEKPTTAPKPQQPDAPQGQVHQQFYPYHYPFYPRPEPENQPATKPTAAPKPEAPQGQVQQQFFSQPEPENKPAEKPTTAPKPPQLPQFVTLPPATSIQQPLNGPPVYCPRSCPSGLSNCCVQIAFHQHLHHIVPAKGTPTVYTGLPFLPSMVYSGFDQGLGSAPLSQKPAEATTTKASTPSTSAPVSFQSFPSKNENRPHHQPPDGNPDAIKGNDPSKLTNPQQPNYPYILPNSLRSYWPYLAQNERLQNVPQGPLPAHYTLPSQPQAPQNKQLNPVVENGQNLQWQQNKPTSNSKPSDSKEQTHPKVLGEPNRVLVPYYQFQGAQTPTLNNYGVPNHSQLQPSVSDSNEPPEHQQTTDAYSEPKGYVLLQQSPPGRESNSFNKSPVPYRPPVHGQSHKLQHPQNLKLPQENPQHPNYMPRPDGKSSPSQHFSALVGPHFVPLPQDPSFSVENLKPKFPDFWKPMAPLGSSTKIPPHVPRKAFQRRSSAGLHRPF